MGLLPTLLGFANPTLGLTYRFAKFVFKLKSAREPISVIEKFTVFIAGDINNKTAWAWGWLAVTLVAGKVRSIQLSKKANNLVLNSDTNKNKAVDLEEIEALLNSSSYSKKPEDVLLRAGLLFLKHNLTKFRAGDADIVKQYGKDGQLDSNACLSAFFGTDTSHKVADVLAKYQDAASLTEAVQQSELVPLLDEANKEIKGKLKMDLLDLVVL